MKYFANVGIGWNNAFIRYLFSYFCDMTDTNNKNIIFDEDQAETKYNQSLPVIVGKTPEIVRIRKLVSELKDNNDPVLIQGEKGTGKELLAQSIHAASKENNHPFVKLNISEALFKSFDTDICNNYSKINRIVSYISDTAFGNDDTGTIYFEAIDTIPLSHQGILLPFFESDDWKKIRIVASSHPRINFLVQEGMFRKDLYFRLNVIKIIVTPLRKRKADIPLLADFFINKSCLESGTSCFQLSDRAKKAMSEYQWPNNVDELKTFIETAESIDREDRILNKIDALIEKNQSQTPDRLNPYIPDGMMDEKIGRVSLKKISNRFISRIETEILKTVLAKTNWNRKQAAETLAISYKSLLNKIKDYKL